MLQTQNFNNTFCIKYNKEGLHEEIVHFATHYMKRGKDSDFLTKNEPQMRKPLERA